jgi:flavocytochrome c
VLRKILLIGLAVVAVLAPILWGVQQSRRPGGRASAPTSADVIVVGSGIGGLSAAYELALGGADVIVVDMSSVFGGHAVMATGDLTLIDTPYQRAHGIQDSPELAYKDFVTWGEDPDPTWTRRYVDTSREQVYDWLTSLGITFETLVLPPGNSVLRTHRTQGRGIGLVTPVFAEVARRSNVSFRWNERVERLLVTDGRVSGVATTSTRTGAKGELHARAVVLATGGFQSNLEMVKAAWRADVPFPAHMLVGSGWGSLGLGHEVAKAAGAALTRLDHQWNYITGLPDPRYPGANRGLNAYNELSVWVNAEGKRFVPERASPKIALPIVARQTGSTYWSVFDEETKHSFWVAGSDWASWGRVERLIFANPDLMKSAPTLEELAAKCGLPAAALRSTIDHFNQMVDAGTDTDFGRFGPDKKLKPKRIDHPPYYAAQFFPMSRKSLGGVAIDGEARALDGAGRAIPGLYAAGELTGFAGINGKYALEGTFLAPSIVTGRVAGRALVAELAPHKVPPAPLPLPPPLPATPAPSAGTSSSATAAACMSCHQLPTLVVQQRPGYWHFEKVHTVVLAKQYDCMRCHADLGPTYEPARHHIDRLAQSRVCTNCHAGEDR